MDLVSINSQTPEEHGSSFHEGPEGIIHTQGDYRVILLEKAPSLGCYDVRATPQALITRKQTIPKVAFEGTESKDWIVLNMRAPSSGEAFLNDYGRLPIASVSVTIGGQETRAQFAPNVEHYSLAIHNSLLKNTDTILSVPDQLLLRSGSYLLDPYRYRSYLIALNQILYSDYDDSEFQVRSTELAIEILAYAAPSNVDRTNRERCVNKAIEQIVATDQRLKLTDLARSCHCSLRTLDYSFSSIMSMTPKQYLDRYMLNRVRHIILNEQSQNIGSIAYSLGYTHLGHMSGSYRALFGETPSATKKSAHPKWQTKQKLQTDFSLNRIVTLDWNAKKHNNNKLRKPNLADLSAQRLTGKTTDNHRY